jgi:hypothetical protein
MCVCDRGPLVCEVSLQRKDTRTHTQEHIQEHAHNTHTTHTAFTVFCITYGSALYFGFVANTLDLSWVYDNYLPMLTGGSPW